MSTSLSSRDKPESIFEITIIPADITVIIIIFLHSKPIGYTLWAAITEVIKKKTCDIKVAIAAP